MASIIFRINYEKAIEAVVWLATQRPKIDIYHIAKVFFYADKAHINKYARPIIGDTYVCADHGPLPSWIHDWLTNDSWVDPIYREEFAKSLKAHEDTYLNFTAVRAPNLDLFSETDIECLEESVEKYADLSFEELKTMSHNERCYYETVYKQPIDYALIIDEDNPFKEELLKEMAETAAYIQV